MGLDADLLAVVILISKARMHPGAYRRHDFLLLVFAVVRL